MGAHRARGTANLALVLDQLQSLAQRPARPPSASAPWGSRRRRRRWLQVPKHRLLIKAQTAPWPAQPDRAQPVGVAIHPITLNPQHLGQPGRIHQPHLRPTLQPLDHDIGDRLNVITIKHRRCFVSWSPRPSLANRSPPLSDDAHTPGQLQLVGPAAAAPRIRQVALADPGLAGASPPQRSADGRFALVLATPRGDPSGRPVKATIDRLRGALAPGTLVGGTVAEDHDLEQVLRRRTPLVVGVVLALGFLLLLAALRAPVVAAIGVLTNLLASAAAFGVAKLVFQDGVLSGLLGFQPQGFLDAWAPVFFFAMVFAISMDYTMFLLSTAREQWDRTGDAEQATVGALERSGRVIFAAGGVMVAVFFTFALSGPLPPKEMGVVLGVAVLLDAALVRLVLLPALLRLLGARAWWRPGPSRRLAAA